MRLRPRVKVDRSLQFSASAAVGGVLRRSFRFSTKMNDCSQWFVHGLGHLNLTKTYPLETEQWSFASSTGFSETNTTVVRTGNTATKTTNKRSWSVDAYISATSPHSNGSQSHRPGMCTHPMRLPSPRLTSLRGRSVYIRNQCKS